MMAYMCKYTPIELIKAFGTEVVMPNAEESDLSEADRQIHSNVCAHARQLLMAVRASDEIVLTTCCDSVRRVADTLSAGGGEWTGHLSMIDLPHADTDCAVRLFAKNLTGFCARYAAETGRLFRKEVFLKEWQTTASVWSFKKQGMTQTPYIAILGARASEELLMAVHRYLLPMAVEDLTCLGSRSLSPPPEGAEQMSDDELMLAYAETVLRQIPCMRMAEIGNRRSLTEDPNLKGIVYNTIRFCDYYDFEYASLRNRTGVPMLKIESDYTSQTRGQLMTRLEAFAEQFFAGSGRAAVRTAFKTGEEKTAEQKISEMSSGNGEKRINSEEPLYVGIDSGSTTTNAAAMDESGRIKAHCVLRTGAKASVAADTALKELAERLGRKTESFDRICATGYGRMAVSFADSVRTEITCHARGAHTLDPSARCVIDIGGQDSKVICLDEDGQVTGFVMNDKCAAGTGRFLEMMARTLELDVSEMDRIGLMWKNDLTISSTCTVFAESEVISLIAEDRETADIIHGLNKAVAARTYGLVQRARGRGPFMMTGGVARNPGLVKEIEEKIGESLIIAEHPDLAGAIGAALFAREEALSGGLR